MMTDASPTCVTLPPTSARSQRSRPAGGAGLGLRGVLRRRGFESRARRRRAALGRATSSPSPRLADVPARGARRGPALAADLGVRTWPSRRTSSTTPSSPEPARALLLLQARAGRRDARRRRRAGLRRAGRRRQPGRPRRPPARHERHGEPGVRHPLLDAGIGKDEVRRLARELGLPTWDAPQQACLASRIPYGEPITAREARRVAAAEGCCARWAFASAGCGTTAPSRASRWAADLARAAGAAREEIVAGCAPWLHLRGPRSGWLPLGEHERGAGAGAPRTARSRHAWTPASAERRGARRRGAPQEEVTACSASSWEAGPRRATAVDEISSDVKAVQERDPAATSS